MKNKIILLSMLSIGSFAHSQSWYLNLKPGYSFAFGTWQQKTTYESPEGKFEVFPRSPLGNIAFGYRAFCGSLDVYQYKKWIFGLSYFKSSAITGENVRYVAQPTSNPSPGGSIIGGSKSTQSTNIYQGGISANYCFYNKKRIKQEFGIHGFLQLNRTSYNGPWISTGPLIDGIKQNISFVDSIYKDKKSFCAQFRYDLSFSNKKGKNLFSVFVLYQQGFGIMGKTYYQNNHSQGYVLNQTATSKSSGFYIGFSKPILLYDSQKKRNNEN